MVEPNMIFLVEDEKTDSLSIIQHGELATIQILNVDEKAGRSIASSFTLTSDLARKVAKKLIDFANANISTA